MRFSIIITFLILSTPSFAKELNGNLDYFITANGDTASLTIINKRNDTSATLTHTSIILASINGQPSSQIEVTKHQTGYISPNLTVSLGSISTLAQQVAPNIDLTRINIISVSENPECTNCQSASFGLKIGITYQGGAIQENLTGAYLHFLYK